MSASVGDISALADFSLTPPVENENEQLLEGDEVKKNGGEEEEDKLECEREAPIGPLFSLKEQLEKDKDDESLQRWKQLLLGNVDFSAVGGKPHLSLSLYIYIYLYIYLSLYLKTNLS
ncbi:Rho protein GDP-dissociation inhibitor [Dillenia turbinata]|uniref:Rho protein GDP-dissociation inhibitor n=1 Tax=Dillenia turbinata TaxID=194707 RepID=A0AAN8UCL5_9MAGN